MAREDGGKGGLDTYSKWLLGLVGLVVLYLLAQQLSTLEAGARLGPINQWEIKQLNDRVGRMERMMVVILRRSGPMTPETQAMVSEVEKANANSGGDQQ